MKNTITQENKWKIHQLIDEGTETERWESLTTKEGTLLEALHSSYLDYPNLVLGFEIKTVNNNKIVQFN